MAPIAAVLCLLCMKSPKIKPKTKGHKKDLKYRYYTQDHPSERAKTATAAAGGGIYSDRKFGMVLLAEIL